MKNIVHLFYRFLFGLSLIAVGYHGLYNIDTNVAHANRTIDVVRERKFFNQPKCLDFVKDHSKKLVEIHYYLFILAGVLSILGFTLKKLVTFLAVAANLIFIHNSYLFYNDDRIFINSLKYVALFGAALNL